MRPAALVFLLALAPAAYGQDGAAATPGDTLTLSLALFYTPEADSSLRAAGSSVGAFVTEAVAVFQRAADSALAGRGFALRIAPRVVRRLAVEEGFPCTALRDRFFAHPAAHAVRDSSDANLAVLVSRSCSDAYQCEPGADCAATAYALVRYDTPWVMAHEVGHTLGMRHDDDPAPGPAHGYRDAAGGFHTLLAGPGSPPTTVQTFLYSDPRRLHNGRPMGVEGVADNAGWLAAIAPEAVTWLEPPVAVEPGPGTLALTVAPNPARTAWRVRIEAPAAGHLHLALHDALGRRLRAEGVAVGAGRSEHVLDAAALAPGAYLLRATWNGAGGPRVGRLALVRTD